MAERKALELLIFDKVFIFFDPTNKQRRLKVGTNFTLYLWRFSQLFFLFDVLIKFLRILVWNIKKIFFRVLYFFPYIFMATLIHGNCRWNSWTYSTFLPPHCKQATHKIWRAILNVYDTRYVDFMVLLSEYLSRQFQPVPSPKCMRFSFYFLSV